MIAEEATFASALVEAVVDDLGRNPPAGAVVRVVIRWFEADDPAYFTLHVLGGDERAGVPADDAWYPLEWPNAEREEERTGRVAQAPAVASAGEALERHYRSHPDDGDWPEPSAAIQEAVRRLPEALRSAEIPTDPELAVSAAHFEGWGALVVLRKVAGPDLIAALEARGELPDE